jgi:DNA-binding response OmpR family regulator
MQAISRRKSGINSQLIPLGEFNVDIQKRTVALQDKDIELTRKEFDLLSYMLLHKNRVLTRLQLSEHIWGSFVDDDCDSNYIDVHIKNIRKKLGVYGSTEWLETVRGVGYKIKKS